MIGSAHYELLEYAVGEEEHALRQLHYWLKWEGLIPFAGVGVFFIPYSLVMMALVGAAVIFAPYLLYQLWRARWFKTIGVFVIVVIGPFASWLVDPDDVVVRFILQYLPLVAFYFFAWILRLVIGEELNERSAVRLFDHERQRNAV